MPVCGGFLGGRRAWLAACLVLVLSAAAPAAAAPRIVAVADVHGDLPAFRSVLVDAGVVDASGAWVGGDTLLVQLGDLLDRGPSMRGILDFVMALEKAAPKAGGRVEALLGNHEVMNLAGDLRYVTPGNFAEFADASSEKRREDAWREVLKLRKRKAKKLGLQEPADDDEARKAWLEAHPPGFLEHRQAFGPEGKYGRWLRSRRAVYATQGNAFLHGGLSPALAGSSLEVIERRVHEELEALDRARQLFVSQGLILPFFDLRETSSALQEELQALSALEGAARAEAEQAGKSWSAKARDVERRKAYELFLDWGSWLINAAEGPFWFRGYSQWTDEEAAAQVPRLTSAFGVRRFVVGHTPQAQGRIRARLDGALVLIDTGMLSGYLQGGRGSALEISGDTLTAIYPGGVREPVVAPPVPRAAGLGVPAARFLGPDGKPLPFASDEEVVRFLQEATVIKTEDIGSGITHPKRLTLERDGVRARAVFRDVKSQEQLAKLPNGRREIAFRDYFGFEPAAYRLGRLVHFDFVPPAALRTHDGDQGSVQLWIEKAMTEERRRKEKRDPPDTLRWKRQQQAMLVWDALVGNTDRNQGNYLYTADWGLWTIDHTRAFRRSPDVAGLERIVWCERRFWDGLKGTGDAAIRAAVAETLVPEEVEGLLERRKRLVAAIEGLIRERGESAVLFAW